MDTKRKGFIDLCNLLKRYKRKVTLSEIIEKVAEEGWYNDFKRIGTNSVIRQINRHNREYPNATELPYYGDNTYTDI